MQIEIEILPDGSFLVPRGTKLQNNILRTIFNGEILDEEGFHRFLEMTDDAELIVGETTLCG